jgi:hypothetical protein
LLKLQLQQLWELDEMEWYVETNGKYIKHWPTSLLWKSLSPDY